MEKHIGNVLMDQHLEFVADAVATFAQECQESTGTAVPPPASAQAAAAPASGMASATRSNCTAARQLILSQLSPTSSPAVIQSPGVPAPPPAQVPAATSIVLKQYMLNDPAYADVWASALRHSNLGDLEECMVWEKEFLLSRLHKNWNDNKALGITAQQLKKRQEQWLAQI
eukprot:773709-Rhodomonas_salina.1